MSTSYLHILFSPRAEGCPRLALDMLKQEQLYEGTVGSVAFLSDTPADLLQDFENLASEVLFLHWKRKGFANRFVSAYRSFRRRQPRGIICYSLGHHVPIAIAASLLRIPLVVHIGCRAPVENRKAMKILRLCMQMGAPFVPRHIACSDSVEADCRNYYGLRNVRRVYNGIKLEKFAELRPLREGRPMEKCSFRVCMVSSLEQSKDHETLLHGFAVLQRKHTDAVLDLVGDGSSKEHLMRLAQELGIANNVEWHGSLNDVRPVLQQADVFAFSVWETEGLGIALVEALAAGIPCVCTDTPATREITRNGERARLISRRDPEAWAEALEAAPQQAAVPLDDLREFSTETMWDGYRAALRCP
jgi:glycosyltransferase involved in cell wall biosynthesis